MRTWTVSPPPGTALTFSAAADARVHESTPATNYGGSTTLRADGGADPDVESYLRFTVTGISGPVTNVKLRLHTTSSADSASGNGPAVYGTGTSWSETGITWSNRPARTTAARSLAAAPRQLGERRLGPQQTYLEAPAVDFDRAHALPHCRRTRRLRRNGLIVLQLSRPRGHQLRLDEPVTRLALDEAGMCEQRLVKADERLDAADCELVERAQHPPARVVAIDAVNDELGDHRVVQLRDLGTGDNAGVHAHSGA